MPIDIEYLRKLAYFEKLNNAELNSLGKYIVEKSANRGDILVFEGDEANALYFLMGGALKSFKTSSDGKEQILNIIRPGESFNDVPVFDNNPSPVSIQAMGPVTLYELNKKDLEAILLDYPVVARNVINILAGKIRHLVSLVEDLSFRHVVGRVAKILLDYAGNEAGAGSRLTQQDMAAMAGTAREVVGRSLKSLEDDGYIRLDRHRIIIRNRDALENMVGANI